MECWRVEYWGSGAPPKYSITPTLRHSIIFRFGGRNIKINTAVVDSAPPKIANESP